MREVRLHDTLSGELRPIEPREPPRVGIYACGPTVYARVHIGQRAAVRGVRAAAALPRARGLRPHAGGERHRRERQDLRRRARAGRLERGAGAGDDRRLRGGHRPARHSGGPTRAQGQRDDRRDRGADRGPGRVRARLRGRRRRVLQRRELPGLRQALEPPARRDAAGRGRRRRRAQARAAGLRALEGDQGGRGHELELALGPGPPGLAHRVLGDGRGDPRRGLRGARRRLRPRLPAPRERDRADRGGARQAARAGLDAQRHGRAGHREDGQVGGQHPPAARRARRVRPRGRS